MYAAVLGYGALQLRVFRGVYIDGTWHIYALFRVKRRTIVRALAG